MPDEGSAPDRGRNGRMEEASESLVHARDVDEVNGMQVAEDLEADVSVGDSYIVSTNFEYDVHVHVRKETQVLRRRLCGCLRHAQHLPAFYRDNVYW